MKLPKVSITDSDGKPVLDVITEFSKGGKVSVIVMVTCPLCDSRIRATEIATHLKEVHGYGG